MPEIERARFIEAEWQRNDNHSEKYMVEINIFANNRMGMLADLSKITTERKIDVRSINSRINKQGYATITMSFEIGGVEELNKLVDNMKKIEGIIDIERN